MKPHDCIFFQLSRAGRSGARYWQRKVAPLGVTAAQSLVLLFLREQDGVTSKDLGDKTEFDSATLTGLLDRLSNAGLVERRSHPQDRRAILVYLTQKGRATTQRISRMVDAENRSFLSNLTPEERLILRALLKKLG